MGEGKTVGPGKIWKIGCEGGHEEPKLPENMGALREGHKQSQLWEREKRE